MIYTENCYRVEAYGQYRLTAREVSCGVSQVTMYDISALRFPLIWSTPLTHEAAAGAFELFKAIGYFDKPVHTEEVLMWE